MDIVGLGVVVVDLLSVVQRYPEVDSKQEALESRVQVGGPVPTALAQLAKFGHRCRLISVWGDDPWGDVIEANLRDTGIAFSPDCRNPDTPTGVSQVWIEQSTGRRTTVTQRPDAALLQVDTHRTAELQDGQVLHLDAWPTGAALTAAQAMKASGGQVFLDTGSPKPGIGQLLPWVDVLSAPRRFAEEFLQEPDLPRAAEALGRLGPELVTVTDGERGAVLHTNGTLIAQSALKGSPVVDTNGAGDAFVGGLIHGVLSDWPPDRILRFAIATGGLKCRSLGNRNALPSLESARAATDFPDSAKNPAPGSDW